MLWRSPRDYATPGMSRRDVAQAELQLQAHGPDGCRRARGVALAVALTRVGERAGRHRHMPSGRTRGCAALSRTRTRTVAMGAGARGAVPVRVRELEPASSRSSESVCGRL